jgi:hypothetical protein
MEGFIVRVTVHHGEPVLVGKLYHRSGTSNDKLVAESTIVNDFDRQEAIVDLRGGGKSSEHTVTDLISEFENEYDCKVSFGDEMDTEQDGVKVHEFDVFEPSWSSQEEAQSVMEDLTQRLVDWAQGYPRGR